MDIFLAKDLEISDFFCIFARGMKIGVFDSGYGGLTILKQIRECLPEYDYLYVGDNARAPYGTRSFECIYHYTLEAVQYMLSQGCALIILACNTASAKALRTIQQHDLPRINAKMVNDQMVNVLGVIRPTVEVVPTLTRTGHIGILATPATVSSESYVLELQKIAPALQITQQACPMWVPLIEAGEHMNDGADYFVDRYLSDIMRRDPEIDTLVLGCTHYPLLLPKLLDYSRKSKVESRKTVRFVAQGELVAQSLADYLKRHPEYETQLTRGGNCLFLTTDDAQRFADAATLFLGQRVQAEQVTY